jgi:hypothetical protein
MVYLGIQKNAQGKRQLLYAEDIFTGHPSRNAYTYRTTSEGYDELGTLTSKYTGGYRIRKDGRLVEYGRGHFTGGTGAYSGLTATIGFAGHNLSTAKVVMYDWTATVTVP